MKVKVISSGISKENSRKYATIKEFVSTGELEILTPYNEIEVAVAFVENSEENEINIQTIADKLVSYYKKNKAKNVKIKSCWTSSDRVYNGLLDEHYYAGWITITFEKDIKNLKSYANNLELKVDEIIREIEKESIEEQMEFNPELTAIATNNSKSAEMLKEVATPYDKILDYGCGTGRNMEFIHSESGVPVDGTDIPQQLEKEKKRHDKLRNLGMTIEASELIENGFYDYILNTHVLNVISSDDVKKMVLVDMYKKLKPGGQAFIEVRTKSDVEGAKTKERFGDGWRIKKGSKFTYQEAISKEKMVNMLTEIGFNIKEHIFNSNRHIVVACK